jgi:hypothetical protein
METRRRATVTESVGLRPTRQQRWWRYGKWMTGQRKPASLAVAALVGTLALVIAASPARASSGIDEIVNHHNHKCLDVKTQNPRVLQLWSCSGASEQHWTEGLYYFTPEDPAGTAYNTFEVFRNVRYTGCIAVDGTRVYYESSSFVCDAYGPFAYAVRWTVYYANNDHGPTNPDGAWYQVWRNVGTHLCMTLDGNSSSNGTGISVTDCDKNSPAQHWEFRQT